jgi:hypothetical protein
MPPPPHRTVLLSSVLKGNTLYIFVAMYFRMNDVTQHKLPYDLTRKIFLGSHSKMCYVRTREARVTRVLVQGHLQSISSAACTRLALVAVRRPRRRSAATQTTVSSYETWSKFVCDVPNLTNVI